MIFYYLYRLTRVSVLTIAITTIVFLFESVNSFRIYNIQINEYWVFQNANGYSPPQPMVAKSDREILL